MEREVDNQVAAPAETRTPNLHQRKIAHRRVRMEGWRQCWRLGRREKSCPTKKQKNPLDSDRSSHGRALRSEFLATAKKLAVILHPLPGSPPNTSADPSSRVVIVAITPINVLCQPFTYASFAAIFPSRTVKISTPRKCHGCPLRIFR